VTALVGVRVLDLTRYVPGPYASMLLADLGADVVKVEEPPLGDPVRAIPPGSGGQGALHAVLNRNKRSIFVDLRTEEGVAVVRSLASRSDVLIESFRPNVLERRGLGAAALLETNPRLVYCSASGYGRRSALADRAGHDLNFVARSGLLGDAPAPPVGQVADVTGGLVAAFAVLAALLARERTGLGQWVDVSLMRGAFALMSVPFARLAAGAPARNELTGAYACYNVYRCRDGRSVAVAALEPKFWERLCRALGHDTFAAKQWSGDPERGRMIDALREMFAKKDRDAWVSELQAKDCCVSPVLDPGEACREPDAAEPLVGLSATPVVAPRHAPRPGEHTDEVLLEAGYSRSEVAGFRQRGAVA
jgi:crotonobetainyl-CoA:carnitine CoA-transferase CaiB-like acyl-CoA transferase